MRLQGATLAGPDVSLSTHPVPTVIAVEGVNDLSTVM